jgi:hypothetical protein
MSGSIAGRTASFDILQEPFEQRIEVSRRFPEGGVPQTAQAMTAAFPQIGIRDGIAVIEIHEGIRVTVHYCKRDQAAFDDQALIHAFPGAGGFEEPLAKSAVCARHGLPEEWFGRFPEGALHESVNVCL